MFILGFRPLIYCPKNLSSPVHTQAITNLHMKMKPMCHDVNCHAQLKEEHVARIKVTEHNEETHRGSSVCQLIQHGTKFRT